MFILDRAAAVQNALTRTEWVESGKPYFEGEVLCYMLPTVVTAHGLISLSMPHPHPLGTVAVQRRTGCRRPKRTYSDRMGRIRKAVFRGGSAMLHAAHGGHSSCCHLSEHAPPSSARYRRRTATHRLPPSKTHLLGQNG